MKLQLPRAAAVPIAVLLMLSVSHSSHAQAPSALGSLYLSFAPDSRVTDAEVEALVPFDVYLVADIPAGHSIGAFEASVNMDPDILFSQITFFHAGFMDLGGGLIDGSLEHIAGLGGYHLTGEPMALAHYRALLLEPSNNVLISVGPIVRGVSSTGGTAPAWAMPPSSGLAVVPFASWMGQEGEVLLNRSVPTEQTSFSRVKALYTAR